MSLVLEIAAGTLVLILSLILLERRRVSKYPPGPPAIPFVGNLRYHPSDYSWEKYAELGKKYGDILFFYNGFTSTLALNNYADVQELLGSRATIYSDRPTSTVIALLKSYSLGLDRWGPEWALRRKLFRQHLNKAEVRTYAEDFHRESRGYASRAAASTTTEQLDDNLRLAAARLILGVTYGLEIDTTESKYVEIPKQLIGEMHNFLRPNYWALDSLPFLRYFPKWFPGAGAAVRDMAEKWNKVYIRSSEEPYEHYKIKVVEGEKRPSFTTKLLTTHSDAGDRFIAGLASSMYSGGADTTVRAIRIFFMAMAAHPDIQRKAQAEIDHVVGNSRLPEQADRDALPYVDALVKEVLRWRVIAPLGLSHRLQQDDVYKGYFIPEGTLVVGNSWLFSQDPEMYPQPKEFLPERFLEPLASGELPMDPKKYIFGYGRRICPGMDFADASIWTTIVTFLATMNISKGIGVDGKEIPIPDRATPHGEVYMYPAVIKPRSEAAATLLAEAIATA